MSSRKRKRSTKAKMSGRIIITAIDEEGAPSAPTYARTKFVNQVGYIVRENIPISFKAWKKAKDLEPADVVPEQEKQLCWEQLMSHFTLPAGQGIEEKVKQFALKKMAIAFQTFKKNLKRDYIKKGTPPDFENKFQKLRPHWDVFVQHTLSEDRADMRERNKINSSKKVASHRTGQGGYRTAIPKWEKMEKDLIEKGITPATLHWPKRAKWYFFAHGGTLDQVTGALIPSDALRAAAERLEAALKLKAEGKFTPNREKDELTYALGTPEHTGRVRGLGVVPWKHGFSEDLETYRSRCRSKAEQDEKFRALEERLSATEERVARLTGQEISLHCNVLIMFYSDLVADAAHLLTLISSLQVKKSRRSAPPPT